MHYLYIMHGGYLIKNHKSPLLKYPTLWTMHKNNFLFFIIFNLFTET